jgi:hypothetical protein
MNRFSYHSHLSKPSKLISTHGYHKYCQRALVVLGDGGAPVAMSKVIKSVDADFE